MATATAMDKAEYDRWASVVCPRVKRTQPWMHGDVRKPLKVMRSKQADVKLARADRSTYDRCAAAMLSGAIWSWKVDDRGMWMVQVVEGGEWREGLLRHQVVELLAELDGGAVAAPVVESVKVAPVVAEPVAVEVAPVREITSARSVGATWPAPVAEYLARLVFEPKRAYAASLAAHLLHPAVATIPADPGTEWAGKVRTKLARLVPAGVERQAVAS